MYAYIFVSLHKHTLIRIYIYTEFALRLHTVCRPFAPCLHFLCSLFSRYILIHLYTCINVYMFKNTFIQINIYSKILLYKQTNV